MKINTASYNDFVKNALVMWRKGYERTPMRAKQLFDVSFNQRLTTEHSSLDGFTYARVITESDDYREENPTQNYSKIMTKYRIGLKATITWKMRTYDQYTEIRKKLSNMGEAASQRMDLDLTHRLTFGTATSYVDMDGRTVTTTVGDGLALFSTAHTVRGASTTYRNIVANNPIFSKGGLESAEELFAQQMIDSNGKKVVVNPDTIVSSNDPNTVNEIRTHLSSTAAPAAQNSGVVNVNQSAYNHVILPLLATDNEGGRDSSKEKYWMLADVSHTDALLEISEMPHMVSPSPGSNSEDFDNDDWGFKTSAAYGIEITDPKWIVLSKGNGDA